MHDSKLTPNLIPLTKSAVEGAKPKVKGRRRDHTVRHYPGLILRVSDAYGTRSKVWLLRQSTTGSSRKAITLGVHPGSRNPRNHPVLESTEAVKAAWHKAAAASREETALDDEISALEARLLALRRAKSQDITLGDLHARWQEHRTAQTKEETRRVVTQRLWRHLPRDWFGQPAVARSAEEIADLVYSIAPRAAAEANSLLMALRQIYRYGCARRLLPIDPTVDIGYPAPIKRRQRYLKTEELLMLIELLEIDYQMKPPLRDAVWMALATAQRRSNVALAEWSEVDLANGLWTIPSHKLKGREVDDDDKPLRVTLGSIAQEVFRRRQGDHPSYVFLGHPGAIKPIHVTSLSNAVRRMSTKLLDDKAIPKKFTTHDLRRTVSTLLVENKGVNPLVCDVMQHHKLDLSNVAKTYIATRLPTDTAEAWLQWDEFLVGLRQSVRSRQ